MSSDLKRDIVKYAKSKKPKKLVAVRLPPDVYSELEKLSKETDQTVSSIVVFALRKALNVKE